MQRDDPRLLRREKCCSENSRLPGVFLENRETADPAGGVMPPLSGPGIPSASVSGLSQLSLPWNSPPGSSTARESGRSGGARLCGWISYREQRIVRRPWLPHPPQHSRACPALAPSGATWISELLCNRIWTAENVLRTIKDAAPCFTAAGSNSRHPGQGMRGHSWCTGTFPLCGFTAAGPAPGRRDRCERAARCEPASL